MKKKTTRITQIARMKASLQGTVVRNRFGVVSWNRFRTVSSDDLIRVIGDIRGSIEWMRLSWTPQETSRESREFARVSEEDFTLLLPEIRDHHLVFLISLSLACSA